VNFFDSRYSEDTADSSYRRHFPDAVVTSHPMTLREIFLTLFRSGRETPVGFIL
jgi:ABC-2 type transport system ATP-binding protein